MFELMSYFTEVATKVIPDCTSDSLTINSLLNQAYQLCQHEITIFFQTLSKQTNNWMECLNCILYIEKYCSELNSELIIIQYLQNRVRLDFFEAFCLFSNEENTNLLADSSKYTNESIHPLLLERLRAISSFLTIHDKSLVNEKSVLSNETNLDILLTKLLGPLLSVIRKVVKSFDSKLKQSIYLLNNLSVIQQTLAKSSSTSLFVQSFVEELQKHVDLVVSVLSKKTITEASLAQVESFDKIIFNSFLQTFTFKELDTLQSMNLRLQIKNGVIAVILSRYRVVLNSNPVENQGLASIEEVADILQNL